MRPADPKLVIAGALGAAAAVVPALLMWGFTVDDALISIRYAHDVATGSGYRFDPHGPSTDGVTPLAWPFLLAPFASGDALATLAFAKGLGVAAWTGAAAALGVAAARRGGLLAAGLGLAVLAIAFPVGAWAASGMETGLATALATIAALAIDSPRAAALLAGLAASLRPELAPWAVALSIGACGGDRATFAPRAIGAALLAGAPLAVASAVRLAVFGHAAPLAVQAKPSDLAHGAVYAGAAAITILVPALASFRRGARAITVAFAVHLLAVVLAGGDWMPYARLVVPVAPSLVLAFAIADMKPLERVARAGVAAAFGIFVAARAAPAGRHVQADREALVLRARPELATSRVVAALDIGWVSAATDASIVDLAGLTDPTIAVLPGGHTSKRVSTGMLLDRGVDTVLVYGPATRIVEQRLVRDPLFVERFERVVTLPLGTAGAGYDVYRRR